MLIRAGTNALGTESRRWQERGERGLGISLDTGTVANVWEATIRFQYSDSRNDIYEGHLESKERFAIQRYLLIIGKKQNMQVLSHTFIYFST